MENNKKESENEKLYKIAIDAIDNLFSDTSVSQDKARVNLENLIEEIHTMLESLEAAADDE